MQVVQPTFQRPLLLAKVGPNLWIGNETVFKNLDLLRLNNIDAIINLCESKPNIKDFECIDYGITSHELMESEVTKTTKKLELICNEVKSLHDEGYCVIVVSFDGLNQPQLIAGYYLIHWQKIHPEVVIPQLQLCYFDDQQRAEEKVPLNDKDVAAKERWALREQKRCLTNRSFCKLLRAKKPAA